MVCNAFYLEIRETAKAKTFFEVYKKQKKEGVTQREAYEVTEQAHLKTYGRRKYSCYNSFRNSARRRYKL